MLLISSSCPCIAVPANVITCLIFTSVHEAVIKHFFRNSKLRSNVFLVSPFKPCTKFIPGRSSGRPLARVLLLLRLRVLSLQILHRRRLKIICTYHIRSALSIPSAATSPDVWYFTIIFAISRIHRILR